MRHSVGQSLKGGRVCDFNQYNESKTCSDLLKILSRELNVEGNVYDINEAYMKYKNDHLKFIKEEYESKFDDYRKINEDEMSEYINRKLGDLPIHGILQQLNLNDLLWDFDAVSLYPSALSDEKSIYPSIETGYAFTPDMNDEIVEKLNNPTFTRGSAFLKTKYYNPKNLIVQHIPVKEKVKKIEVNRMRNGYNINTLTSVDIHEIVKTGGQVIESYEVAIYRENFKVSPFKKVIDQLFELRQRFKDEKKDVMHLLVKLIVNSLYGEQIHKRITDSYEC